MIYPCTITADRYGGSYSGAAWTAWPLDAEDIPQGPEESDPVCRAFWDRYEEPVGKGRTATAAYNDLVRQVRGR